MMKTVGKILLYCYIVILLFWPADLAEADVVVYLVISEVQVAGGTADDEFIEIYNPNDADIDLSTFPLKLHLRNSSGTDSNRALTFVNSTILSGGYFLIGPAVGYLGSIPLDAAYSVSGTKLVNDGSVYISNSTTADIGVIDKLGWGGQPVGGFESVVFATNPDIGRVLSRKIVDSEYIDTDDNSQDFESGIPTPGALNIAYEEPEPDPEEPTTYSTKILINEFLPAPGSVTDWDDSGVADASDEWIEIINLDDGQIDLGGWILDDISDGGSSPYIISADTIIEPDGFLVFYKKDTSLVLNNTGDSVILKNPNGDIVDNYSYTSTSSDKSFSRDSNSATSSWVTTYTPSPGALNLAPGNQYPIANAGSNVVGALTGEAVNFNGSASRDNDGTIVSYEWNFGDGSATLTTSGSQTFHIYSVPGTYQVNLTVRDNSGATGSASITVSVVENTGLDTYQNQYSSQIKIIEVMPNPIGSDSEGEYVKLSNLGSSDINLRNWSLDDEEGGSKPFLIDYDVLLKIGDSLVFYSTDTKLSLNNSGDSVRLFDPDGKLIDSVTYSEKAAEGIPYILENSSWRWDIINESVETENLLSDNKSGLTGPGENISPEVTAIPVNSTKPKPDVSKILIKEPTPSLINTKTSTPQPVEPLLESEVESIFIDTGLSNIKLTSNVSPVKPSEALPTAQSDFPVEASVPSYQKPIVAVPIMAIGLLAVWGFVLTPKNFTEILNKFLEKQEKGEDLSELFK